MRIARVGSSLLLSGLPLASCVSRPPVPVHYAGSPAIVVTEVGAVTDIAVARGEAYVVGTRGLVTLGSDLSPVASRGLPGGGEGLTGYGLYQFVDLDSDGRLELLRRGNRELALVGLEGEIRWVQDVAGNDGVRWVRVVPVAREGGDWRIYAGERYTGRVTVLDAHGEVVERMVWEDVWYEPNIIAIDLDGDGSTEFILPRGDTVTIRAAAGTELVRAAPGGAVAAVSAGGGEGEECTARVAIRTTVTHRPPSYRHFLLCLRGAGRDVWHASTTPITDELGERLQRSSLASRLPLPTGGAIHVWTFVGGLQKPIAGYSKGFMSVRVSDESGGLLWERAFPAPPGEAYATEGAVAIDPRDGDDWRLLVGFGDGLWAIPGSEIIGAVAPGP